MGPVLRTWCPLCSKPSGVVTRDNDGNLWWEDVTRSSFSATAKRLGRDVPATGWFDNPTRVLIRPGPSGVDEVFTTCRGGHPLVVDLVEVASAARAGVRSVPLRSLED